MALKIGINGMGRIGRMIVRSIYENHRGKIIIKHINNRSNSLLFKKYWSFGIDFY